MMTYRHTFELAILCIISFLGYKILRRMFVGYKTEFLRAGFSGVDMNKPGKPTLPEAQGVLAGAVFIILMFLFIPVPFWRFIFGKDYFMPLLSCGGQLESTEERQLVFKSQFIHFLAGLLSICCMVFLGFADDALDLQWRHKCILPSLASLPLLMVYFADDGTTRIVVPVLLRSLFGMTVDIGLLYYVYMGLLTVFCTNTINIYAGINGLEVGQTLVIAISVMVHNVLELHGPLWRVHLFSLYFLIPFAAVTFALWKVNRYPASVFVGDTFCYFAGMTLAVVGVLGHFSKTLLLFFLPQIFNFIYSLPQLFILIPCPRHRLPCFDPDDNKLHTSKVRFHPKSLSTVGQFVLNTYSRLGLVECRNVHAFNPPTVNTDETTPTGDGSNLAAVGKQPEEEIVEVNNMTLINIWLRLFGPMTEEKTTLSLLKFQIFCSLLAFSVRYPLAWMFYEVPVQ